MESELDSLVPYETEHNDRVRAQPLISQIISFGHYRHQYSLEPIFLTYKEERQRSKWLGDRKYSDKTLTYLTMDFSRPILLNGLGFKSANCCPNMDPRKMTVYYKQSKQDTFKNEEEEKEQDCPPDLLKGFNKLMEVDVEFDSRWQTKKFLVPDGGNKIATSLIILINHTVDTMGENGEFKGVQLGQLMFYQ